MSFFLFIWVCYYNEQQTDFFLTVCLVTKPFFTSQWMYGVARAVRLKPRLQVPDIIPYSYICVVRNCAHIVGGSS